MTPHGVSHSPACVELSRHSQGGNAVAGGAAVVETSRQPWCGPGWWRCAISALVPPLCPIESCREMSTGAEAVPGSGGRGRIASLCEVPRQRRVCRCPSCAGPGSCGCAEIFIPGNDIPCTISGTQCLPTRRGAADQPERLPWILPRIRISSLARPADVRRPMSRPRSCDCSTWRLRFRLALGWCWRGGGW